MNRTCSVQAQTVLYHNHVDGLIQALDNLANAIRVDRMAEKVLGQVTVCYGDASKEPLFSDSQITQLQNRYAEYFQLQYTFFNENTGTSKGHNRMAENCDADYLLIMNPDILVNPHFFGHMLTPFFTREQIGMTEARQTPIEHHKEYDTQSCETKWGTGAASMVPTALFRQVKGFDADTFFMYCDDVDLSWRLRLEGYKILYVPQAVVFHAKHVSNNTAWQPTKAEVYYSAEAALLMAHKYSNPKRVKRLLKSFLSFEGTANQEAARNFLKRQKEGRLPEPIDPNHTVAEFTEEGYGTYRFQMK